MTFTATVISAREWGAVPPTNWPAETTPRFIVIHHTASPNPPNDASRGTDAGARTFARNLQRAHMEGFGWADSGHNFLNTTGGILLEGRQNSLAAIKRGRCVRSAHAGTTEGNASPGIENEGTFTTYQMPAVQWKSLVELCASICDSCKISPDNIRGHRDFVATQCPGDWLYGQLPRLRQDVRTQLAGSPVDNFLRVGSTGSRVTELQQLLLTRGFNPGPIDGVFGTGTQQATKNFQKYQGLDPNGVADDVTIQALRVVPPPLQPTPPPIATTVKILDTYRFFRDLPHQQQAIQWLESQLSPQILGQFTQRWRSQPTPDLPTLKQGDSGDAVRQLQQRLQSRGFYPGAINGNFDTATRNAVIAFQRSQGLQQDGVAGANTWRLLNS